MIQFTVAELITLLQGKDPKADAAKLLSGDKDFRLLWHLVRASEAPRLDFTDLKLTADERKRLRKAFGLNYGEMHGGATAILSLLRAWDGRGVEPRKNRDVHTEHCCAIHGCKYGRDDCPVETKKKAQSYACEACEDYGY